MTRAGRGVVAILIAWSGTSQAGTLSERFLIPWGDGPGAVGHRLTYSGSFGPTDFAVVEEALPGGGDALVLLDREQGLCQRFGLESGAFLDARPVPPLCERLAWQGDSLALWDGLALHRGSWGRPLRGASWPSFPFRTIERLAWQGEDLFALDHSGNAFRLTRRGALVEPEAMRVEEAPWPVVHTIGRGLEVVSPGGQRVVADLPFEPGAVEYVGRCGTFHVVLADDVRRRSPIEAREVLVFIPEGAGPVRVVSVPYVYDTWMPRRFAVTRGRLVALVSSPRGLHVLVADSADAAQADVAFPPFPEDPFHFNDHLPLSPDEAGELRDEDPIARSEIMSIARAYVDLQWTASSSNVTNGIQQMPDGSYVRTPAWVTVGPKQKVPYKWGGFTSVPTFVAGVPAGKKCGDDYTESVSWTDLYCIGVDCSGFVSRCWDTSQKYGTSTLYQIATALPSFADMKRGDCLNLPSSHVRLCAEDNPPGAVLTMEASAYDWRVSYRSYTLTALASYTPMRFNWVIEEPPVGPFVVRVKEGVTALNVRQGPSTAEAVITTIAGGQKFVATRSHDGWYYVCIPSGTGSLGGWSLGGTTSTNGYLEGSQITPIVTVTASTLNVREGPGTSYAVITTVSEGQHFAVLSSSAGWYQIQLCNTPGFTSGWASGSWLALTPGGPRDGYGASLVSTIYPAEVEEGMDARVTLELSNVGQTSWDAGTLLATTVPRGRASLFVHPSWTDSSTVGPLGAAVLPSQRHTMSFMIRAPLVPSTMSFIEHFGLRQYGFCWFGDPSQRGPDDDAIALGLLVQDVGGLATPVIDVATVSIEAGQLSFSWAPVPGASTYRVFRSPLGGTGVPDFVAQTTESSFASPVGVGDPALNVQYRVRAYAGVDSSSLSNAVGEQDFSLP